MQNSQRGRDAALCLFPQHPAVWDLYLSGNQAI
jgi:hypothetical protein